jgi:hypothetical protein
MWNPSRIDGPFDWPELFGYHVNIDVALMVPELETFVIPPPGFTLNSLNVVWAGDDPEAPRVTVPLLFADEAEARASALGKHWIESPSL